MRIDFNASGLAKLTTRVSFFGASHSNNSAPPPAPHKEPSASSALDHMFPLGGRVRDMIERGQSFGFFAKNIDTASDVRAEKFLVHPVGAVVSGNHQFDCATIYIDDVKEGMKGGYPSLSLEIFKDKKSGAYFVGSATDDTFVASTSALDDAGLYWKIFEWSRACATMYPSKRMALIDTMSDKPTPSIGRFARSVIAELGAYIHKGFC